jgi:predicted DNA-binding protein
MESKNISLPDKLSEKLEERSENVGISEAEIVRTALTTPWRFKIDG